MEKYILPIADIRATLENVGGKGMSLARLSRMGMPVPGGFHITTAAYIKFVEINDLQPAILKALDDLDLSRPASLEAASQTIQGLFLEKPIPDDISRAILDAYSALSGSNPAVAVRSSATAEDLPEASFAGQQETFLNISGTDRVLESVRKCWASLWTGRAISYRARQNIPADGAALAVVVQLMVNAEAAGILFTANPINGSRSEAIINAAWGFGEAVVSGRVTPDTITIDKQAKQITQRDTAEKRLMTSLTENGTDERLVPETLQSIPVLSDQSALALMTYGMQIEEQYEMPMDIEWALAGDEFAILQARPITALPEPPIEWKPPNPKGTYMRASVADLMPKPLSPLFATLWIPAQREQMKPLGKRMTGSTPVLIEDYITSINNYSYVNAAMPPGEWWWALTALIPSYYKLIRKSVQIWRDELLKDYRSSAARNQSHPHSDMSSGEIWQEVQDLVDAAAYYVCGLMFATLGASAGSEGLLTRVYDRFAKREDDPDATVLLMGWNNIPARSEKSLYDIAMWVKQDQDLAKMVSDTSNAELVAKISNRDEISAAGSEVKHNWDEFADRLTMHLNEFGHIIFQLDFAEPLPCDHPEMMLETIKMYIRGEGVNPHIRQKSSEEKRIETTQTMLNRLKGIKRWIFQKALNWGQSTAEVREDALSEIGLAYPRIRILLFELGRRLAGSNAIRQPADIFWLERAEVDSFIADLDNGGKMQDLDDKVKERKALHARLVKETPPPMMPFKERVMGVKAEAFIAQTQESQTGSILKGVPTSGGKVTAPACILLSSEDFDLMHPGDVLVAPATTPAWTPLFVMAAAVVTDIGGPLSHGSIVAREYGIPAVMGTGVATKRIQNRQMITVDGNVGTVILEDQ